MPADVAPAHPAPARRLVAGRTTKEHMKLAPCGSPINGETADARDVLRRLVNRNPAAVARCSGVDVDDRDVAVPDRAGTTPWRCRAALVMPPTESSPPDEGGVHARHAGGRLLPADDHGVKRRRRSRVGRHQFGARQTPRDVAVVILPNGDEAAGRHHVAPGAAPQAGRPALSSQPSWPVPAQAPATFAATAATSVVVFLVSSRSCPAARRR